MAAIEEALSANSRDGELSGKLFHSPLEIQDFGLLGATIGLDVFHKVFHFRPGTRLLGPQTNFDPLIDKICHLSTNHRPHVIDSEDDYVS